MSPIEYYGFIHETALLNRKIYSVLVDADTIRDYIVNVLFLAHLKIFSNNINPKVSLKSTPSTSSRNSAAVRILSRPFEEKKNIRETRAITTPNPFHLPLAIALVPPH